MPFGNNLSLRVPTLKKAKRLALEEPLMRRILLVDDDADTLALIRIWLTQQGFDVSVAANGSEALSQIQEEPPDLIVTDQSMPRMTGLELCARLRARAKTRHIPIIMCSAQPLQPADGLFERALLKPASLAQLSDEIVSLLESRPLKLQQPRERGSG